MLKIKVAIFPGRFEPITLNHLNIIGRALKLFDKIIVLVLNNPNLKPIISIPNRLKLIKLATQELNVETDYWEHLIIDYAEIAGACAIIKTIKNSNTFEKDYDMSIATKLLKPNIETVFFPVNPKYGYINSELILKLAIHKKNLEMMVPAAIIAKLTKILSEV